MVAIYTYDAVPRLGQFRHMCAGAFNPLPADETIHTRYWNMPFTDAWPGLHLRGEDGNVYTYGMWAKHDFRGGLQGGKWAGNVMAASEGAGPLPQASEWSSAVRQELTPAGELKYHHEGEVVTYDGKTASWVSEDGQINMHGRLVAPGIGLLLPWRDPNGHTDQMYYTSQYYHVEGVYYGVKASGQLMLDAMWGTTNYRETWWVRNRQGHWTGWYAAYDDGTYEMGHLLLGRYGARAAVITNSDGQEILNTIDIRMDVTRDDKGAVAHIVYTFDGEQQWELVPNPPATGKAPPGFQPGGAMLGNLGAGAGQIRRVGERRKLVNWWSWSTGVTDSDPNLV